MRWPFPPGLATTEIEGSPGDGLEVSTTWAGLAGGSLVGADLCGSNLRGADLRAADLVGAVLDGADLREADLEGCYLIDAGVRGALLPGADLGPVNVMLDPRLAQRKLLVTRGRSARSSSSTVRSWAGRGTTVARGADVGEESTLISMAVDCEGASQPVGFDGWGLVAVQPDLHNAGFKWSVPGSVVEPGRGVLVASTWGGLAVDRISARTVLLVAVAGADQGADEGVGPRRRSKASVVAVLDTERYLRDMGEGAVLDNACLHHVNLELVDLQGAHLAGVDFTQANLCDANLTDADPGADLRDVRLSHTSLDGADTTGAKRSRSLARRTKRDR